MNGGRQLNALEEDSYRQFFQERTRHAPYDYQVKVAQALVGGSNIVLRAPTGAGKTNAVLVPFLYSGWVGRPTKLIYALPLRTLAQGIYREAQGLAQQLGYPVEAQKGERGREVVSPFVTLQTGEQPDDPFFDRGRIIVTTYDQVLSGLLDGPYGLSSRLHNVNAASIVGALVVFDEFHLMEPQKAFLTAVACLRLFRDLCQSVWMTATATQPLEEVLRDALDAVSIPDSEREAEVLHNTLPCVNEVSRQIVIETEPLSAESVLRWHEARSLVLLNTVGRAQAMHEALRAQLNAKRSDVPLMLLHSRFFKGDRKAKEGMLRSTFGRGAKGSAILVATQVVEAGLDISCDQLHTELCPMNALVQRAGRCARFAGETGTVHVYPLPSEERAWLPYGNLHREEPTLGGTRELLQGIARYVLQAGETAEWVQKVHAQDDAMALRSGWRAQMNKCLGRIQQNALIRDPKTVADLIRGDDSDSIRVIIDEEETRPANPGEREGLSLSRWSLARLFRNEARDVGWFWDGSDHEPWKPLRALEDLRRTYVVCLRPGAAAYDRELGLRLGVSGSQRSPRRIEPKRPGYAALHAESWDQHTRNVAEEGRRRLERDGVCCALTRAGLGRYGLTPEGLMEAIVACALLHDLGKLQEGWQRWAEAAQRARDPGYQHTVPLAHTDYDPDGAEGGKRDQTPGVHRPPHAAASAYYGRAFIGRMLPSVLEEVRACVASACVAAVLGHHGGWWSPEVEANPPKLWPGWEIAVGEAIGWEPDGKTLASLRGYKVEKLLGATTGAESLPEWWPLVAYLTRTLRLSDQRATAEGASNE